MTDLAKLADAIEAADADAGTITNARLAMEQQLREIAQREAVALARADGLRHALFLINGEAKAPEPVAPVEKPPAKDTLGDCIKAIRNTFIFPLRDGVTDYMVQEQLANAGHKYKLPSVRNALKKIGEEIPATEPSASGQAAQYRPSPQEAPGNSADGAGLTDSFPDIPANLRRAPTRTAAE